MIKTNDTKPDMVKMSMFWIPVELRKAFLTKARKNYLTNAEALRQAIAAWIKEN